MDKIDSRKQKSDLSAKLNFLKLSYFAAQYEDAAKRAADKNWSHLEELATGEVDLKRDRSIKRRIQMTRFPVIKTIQQFQWNWPKEINRMQIQNLFRLKFIADRTNVIFFRRRGLGKIAPGHGNRLRSLS